MIKQNTSKSEIEIKRKELDKLLRQYTKEIWNKIHTQTKINYLYWYENLII